MQALDHIAEDQRQDLRVLHNPPSPPAAPAAETPEKLKTATQAILE